MPKPWPLLGSLVLLTACTLPLDRFERSPTPLPIATSVPGSRPTATPSQAGAATSAPLAPADGDAAINAITAAVPDERDPLALAEAFGKLKGTTMTRRTTPLDVNVGDVTTFSVLDNIEDTNYEVQAKLRYAGPVVLMYVDTKIDADVSQKDVEYSAKQFEDSIYKRDRALFGKELSPGIDGDTRITILNTAVRGAGGYFSADDGQPKAVNPFSNERDMFVIGVDSYPLGTDDYGSTLAHEFQHMIHFNEQRRSPSWFNEGLSTLAEDLNGFVSDSSTYVHLDQPDIQLTTWSTDSATTGKHYGTSQLFFRYFYQQYAQESGVAELIQADAGNNPEAFVSVAKRKRPEINSFAEIVADWAVANMIDDKKLDGGRYAYDLLPDKIVPTEVTLGQGQADVSQYGADYLELPKGTRTFSFDGSDAVSITGVQPESGYAWWSNRADDSVQTLTHSFDLRNVSSATLNFDVWHEIERNWDYGYVSVSIDGGKTWQALKASTTVTDDPQGNNLGGQGFTGVSGSPGAETDEGTKGAWIKESVDLTPYAGKEVLVRFWLVEDAAYNAAGLMLDNISIPELNYRDDAETDGGWDAKGFVRVTGTLPQRWTLRLIREAPGKRTVEAVPTDAEGRATITLAEGERGTVMIMGSTPHTTQTASYSYDVEE